MPPLRSRVSLLVITLVLAFASVASASTNANLAVSQAPTMDGDRTAGSTMTYLVHVTNNGPDSVANVTFGDQLGDPEQFMSAHTSTGDACTQAPPVSCTLQRVDPGADITIQIVVKLTKTGSNSN